MFILDPTIEPSIEIIGSNLNQVANFTSTTGEAYIRVFGNDQNSNIAYSMGCSNADDNTPTFVIGEIVTNPFGIAPDIVIRDHQVCVGTKQSQPGYAFTVDGSVYISSNIYATNLTPSAFVDTTNANNIISGTFSAARFPESGATSGVYGASNMIPRITVDSKGRITSIQTVEIADAFDVAQVAFTGDYNSLSNITFSLTSLSNAVYTAGNVGIGTTIPLSQMHVTKQARVNSLMTSLIHPDSSGIGNFITASTDVNVDGRVCSGGLQVANTINLGLTDDGNGRYTNVNYNATDIRFRVQPYGEMYVLSNVGIGTTAPRYPLHVLGETYSTSFTGVGSNLTLLNASNITSGRLANDRLPLAFSVATNSQAITVDASGNVGIGTAIPDSRLHVQGDIYASGTLTAKDLVVFGDTTVLNTTSSNTEQMVITNAGTGPALKVVQSGVNTVAEFYDSDVVGGIPSLIIANGGNIGVGTLSPDRTFHVVGDILATGTLAGSIHASSITSGTLDTARLPSAIAVSTLAGDGASLSNLNATYITTGTLASARLPTAFNVNTSTPCFTITSSSNVGIATTNPQSKFHVYGDTFVDGNLRVGYSSILQFDLTTRQMIHLYGSVYGIGVQSYTQYYRTDGHFGWYLRGVHSDDMLDAGGGSSLMVLTSDGQLSPKSLDLGRYIAGREINAGKIGYAMFTFGALDIVGAGTTVGLRNIMLWDNVYINNNLYVNNKLITANAQSDYSLIGTHYVDNEENTRIVLSGHTRGNGYAGHIEYVSTGTNGCHRFYTNSAEKMRLVNDGNLGIGITTPQARLHVSGNAIISSSVAAQSFAGDGASLSNLNASYITTGTFSNARLPPVFNVQTLNPTITVLSDGNVGIGTTAPVGALQVAGMFNTGAGFIQNISANRAVNVVGTDSVVSIVRYGGQDPAMEMKRYNVAGTSLQSYWDIYTTNEDDFRIRRRTAGTTTEDALLIDTNKNIGVGTATPQQKLHVHGNSFVSATMFTSNISGNAYSLSNLNASYLSSGTLANARLPTALNVNTTSQSVTIDASGNVGIATSTPLEKLHVEGTVKINNVGTGPAIKVLQTGSQPIAEFYDADVSSSVPRVTIANNGNIGIGTTTPIYPLQVEADTYFTRVFTTEFKMTSDINLKTNVRTIENAIDLVDQLRGVHFEWKQDSMRKSIGMIAQEVETVLPELVHNDANGFKSISYGNMIGLLVEAMKEQQKQICELQSLVRNLASRE